MDREYNRYRVTENKLGLFLCKVFESLSFPTTVDVNKQKMSREISEKGILSELSRLGSHQNRELISSLALIHMRRSNNTDKAYIKIVVKLKAIVVSLLELNTLNPKQIIDRLRFELVGYFANRLSYSSKNEYDEPVIEKIGEICSSYGTYDDGPLMGDIMYLHMKEKNIEMSETNIVNILLRKYQDINNQKTILENLILKDINNTLETLSTYNFKVSDRPTLCEICPDKIFYMAVDRLDILKDQKQALDDDLKIFLSDDNVYGKATNIRCRSCHQVGQVFMDVGQGARSNDEQSTVSYYCRSCSAKW